MRALLFAVVLAGTALLPAPARAQYPPPAIPPGIVPQIQLPQLDLGLDKGLRLDDIARAVNESREFERFVRQNVVPEVPSPVPVYAPAEPYYPYTRVARPTLPPEYRLRPSRAVPDDEPREDTWGSRPAVPAEPVDIAPLRLPSRTTVGEQFHVSTTLTNRTAHPVKVELNLQLSPGLEADQTSKTVRLGAKESKNVRFGVTPTKEGPGTVRITGVVVTD